MFSPSLILLLIISFLYLSLGLFVYLRNPRARVNTSFALFALSALIWINVSFFEDEINNIGLQYLLMKLDFAFGIISSFLLLLFCLDISKAKLENIKYVRLLLMAVPVFFSIAILSSRLIISGYEFKGGVIDPVFGTAYPVYALLIGLTLISGVGTLLWSYRYSSPEDKAKFVYLLIGFFLSSAIAFATNILLAGYIKTSPHYGLYSRFGLFSSVFVILFSGYAIVKHRLFNLKVIAAETLSLGILVFSLVQLLLSDRSELLANAIIFSALLVFVIMLVRSIENEVKRKDELQVLSADLEKANDKLQELDKARAEFMSMASHQLQTPLTAIRGYSSLLLEKSEGSLTISQEDMIKKIAVSSERMVQLVEDYLNLSRIESGKMEYKFAKWQLEDICQEVVDTLALKAKDRNLLLRYEKPNTLLPEIMIDGHKIREVISNLIDNAVKYTPSGGVTVMLELRRRMKDEQTDYIRVTVSDTGLGISEAELPHLFVKFGRGTNEERLKIKGTGLGLFVAKNMVENNGGRIWAESDEQDKGSRFIVELPVVQSREVLQKWA